MFDRVVRWLPSGGLVVGVVYFCSMVIWPWIEAGGDWHQVQRVWNRWQGFNVGMLALISSLIFFSVSRSDEKHKRARAFNAYKALMPSIFSDLCDYFKECGDYLQKTWDQSLDSDARIPSLPDYEDVFQKCIENGDSDVGAALAEILADLQVHHARFSSFGKQKRNTLKPNMISYAFSLGKLQVQINTLFPYFRNQKDLTATPLKYTDFQSAYRTLGIKSEEFTLNNEYDLESFTARWVDRQSR